MKKLKLKSSRNFSSSGGRGRKFEKNTNLGYHLAPRLVSFPVIGLLLELLQDAFAGGTILERELGYDAAKLVGLCVRDPVQRYSQPQDELVEAIDYATVDYAQDDYSLGTVRQKV